MNTARQIIRFSIPGSIFLLHAAVCYLIYRRVQGVSFVTSSAPIQENLAAAIAIAATIPVGFIIYQLYYFTYEPVLRIWPLAWGGRFVRRDRGWQILQTLDQQQLKALEGILGCVIDPEEPHSVVQRKGSVFHQLMHLSGVLEIDGPRKELPMDNKARQSAYEHVWYTHWDALRATVDIAGSYTVSEQVKSEYTTLSDIYHSLGAARTAVLCAWFGVFLLAASHVGRLANSPGAALGGFVLITGITVIIYLVFHVARGRTWRSAAASLTFGLQWFHWRHGHELAGPDG